MRRHSRLFRAKLEPTAMTKTVSKLAERFTKENGRPPTDAEMAAALAISVNRVRHRRRRLAETR